MQFRVRGAVAHSLCRQCKMKRLLGRGWGPNSDRRIGPTPVILPCALNEVKLGPYDGQSTLGELQRECGRKKRQGHLQKLYQETESGSSCTSYVQRRGADRALVAPITEVPFDCAYYE